MFHFHQHLFGDISWCENFTQLSNNVHVQSAHPEPDDSTEFTELQKKPNKLLKEMTMHKNMNFSDSKPKVGNFSSMNKKISKLQ